MIKLITVQTSLGIAHLNPLLIAAIDEVKGVEPQNTHWYVRLSGSDFRIDNEAAQGLLAELQGDKPQAALDELHLRTIISAERGETSSNQRPMWRCLTDEGEKVNIFLNEDDKEKDSFHLFEQAGWGDILQSIMLYSTVDLAIQVAIQLGKPTKDGKRYWEFAIVRPFVPANEPF